jgi:hypothetical protein
MVHRTAESREAKKVAAMFRYCFYCGWGKTAKGHTTFLIIQPTKLLISPNTLCGVKKEAADLEHAAIHRLSIDGSAEG